MKLNWIGGILFAMVFAIAASAHGHHYRWVAGRWDHPPYEGASWNHPHYDHYQQGWQLHEGHWDHENRDSHEGHQGDHHEGHGGDHHDH